MIPETENPQEAKSVYPGKPETVNIYSELFNSNFMFMSYQEQFIELIQTKTQRRQPHV